jgi:hypothetical protein
VVAVRYVVKLHTWPGIVQRNGNMTSLPLWMMVNKLELLPPHIFDVFSTFGTLTGMWGVLAIK